MVSRIFTTVLASASLLFVLSSCTKDSTIVGDPVDVIGSWQVTGIHSNVPYDWDGDGFTETDILRNYSYCQQDIVLVFEQGGYGQTRQGCNAPWQSLYWQMYSGNRTLSIQLPGDNLELDIRQFSYNTIRGDDYVYIDGRNFVITYTLSRR